MASLPARSSWTSGAACPGSRSARSWLLALCRLCRRRSFRKASDASLAPGFSGAGGSDGCRRAATAGERLTRRAPSCTSALVLFGESSARHDKRLTQAHDVQRASMVGESSAMDDE